MIFQGPPSVLEANLEQKSHPANSSQAADVLKDSSL